MSRVPRAHFNFYRPEVVDMSYQKIQKMIEDNPGLAPAPVLAGEEPVVKRVVAGLNSAGLKFEPGLEKVDSLVSAIVGKMGDMSNSTVNVASAQVSSIVSKWYNGHKKSLRTTAGAIAAGAIVLFAVCIVVGMAVKFEMTPEQIQQLWGRTGQSLATNASKLWDIIKDTFTGIEFETVFKFVPEASPVPAPGVRGPGVAAAKAAMAKELLPTTVARDPRWRMLPGRMSRTESARGGTLRAERRCLVRMSVALARRKAEVHNPGP